MLLIKKFILVFSLIVLFGSFFSALSASAHDELPIAIVVAHKGEVYLYRDGSEKKIQIRGSEGIYWRDTLITNSGAAVKVLATDDSVITLGADSALKVNVYNTNRDVTQRVVRLRLIGGSLRAIVHHAYNVENSTFQVETNAAVVTAKGTDFIMSSVGEGLEVATISGSVGVKGVGLQDGPEFDVPAGYMTGIGHDGKFTKPGKLDPSKLNKFLAMTDLPVTMAFELALQGCQACHMDKYKVIDESAFKHSESKQCAMCHMEGALNAGERDKNLQVAFPSRDNIIFIGTNKYSKYSVSVRIMDDTGLEATSDKIEFMDKDIKEMPGDDVGPDITDLKVKEVKSGVFLITVITWQTDRPTLSSVEFGERGDYSFTVKGSNHYVTDHRVNVDRLKPGKTYNLRAVSEDVFGNVGVSESINVKVDKPFLAEQEEGELRDEIVLKDFDVIRVGGKVALRWSSDIKTMASVNIVEKVEDEESDNKVVLKDKHAPGLRDDFNTGFTSCDECHRGDVVHMKAAHPTGTVDWSKGTIKAKGLPLATGAQIMCSTCHESHGSGLGFMLRMNEKELCGACHRERAQF